MVTADGLWGSIPGLLFGIGCIVLAGLLVAPTLAGLLAAPWCIIYYPKRKLRNEDLDGLEDITFRRRWFEDIPFVDKNKPCEPDNDLSEVLERYTEQIRTAVDDLRNEDLGRAILEEALVIFRQFDDQTALRSAFIGACRAVKSREKGQDSSTLPER